MKKYLLRETEGKRIETHIDFKGELNDEQYRVVTEGDGPCLVLAGAGSGKTRTLIYRLAYLLESGVRPYNILLMTFTNKAAREMRTRTETLLGYEPKGLWSGTFHHVGNRSLRMHAPEIGFGRDFGILDQQDSRELIKVCVKNAYKRTKDEEFPKPSVIQSIISFSNNTDKTIGRVLEEKYPYFYEFKDLLSKIKDMYARRKKESNNMDYDDLLLKWKWLLENVPEVKEKFCRQFQYIMVDEYQDTNFLQADITDILCAEHKNILVVGDDAQSIYSFRGARVENILRFPKKFTDAKIFKLETNYRSTPEVLELANDSLGNNDNQFEKTLKAVNPSVGMPVLVEVRDLYGQAAFVAQRVQELIREGTGIDDMAVLFRAHYQSAELEMELVKRSVPYVVRGGIRFFEQAHIKDVLSHIKIMVNPADEVAWIRALTLCPGIGPGYAARIYEAFIRSGMDLASFLISDVSKIIPGKAQGGYLRFQKTMRSIVDAEPGGTTGEKIKQVLESGYETHVLAAFDNAKDRIDDIHELVNFSHGYGSVNEFLSDITLREPFRGETIDETEGSGNELVLSTIHQAKGLEWSAVMLIGLCEGQFPHHKSIQEDPNLEEERRLFYVAVTRAKKYLYMIYPAMRYDYKMGLTICHRSTFLEELPKEDYEVWTADSFDGFGYEEERSIEL